MYACGPMKTASAFGLACKYRQCGLGLAQWPQMVKLSPCRSACRGRCVAKGWPSSSVDTSVAKACSRISSAAIAGSSDLNCGGMYMELTPCLFPLDGRGRLAADVVRDAVDA